MTDDVLKIANNCRIISRLAKGRLTREELDDIGLELAGRETRTDSVGGTELFTALFGNRK